MVSTETGQINRIKLEYRLGDKKENEDNAQRDNEGNERVEPASCRLSKHGR